MDTSDFQTFLNQLKTDGVLTEDGYECEPLTGGVSSEIYKVSTEKSTFVVKRALPQLKVAAHWEADLSRNAFEVRYLKYVSKIVPDAVPRIIREGEGYFVMEYLGGDYGTWKAALLEGILDSAVASRIGDTVGRIHARSQGVPSVRDDFQSVENFKQLRISPYIDFLQTAYPNLKQPLEDAARELACASECLVHGDLSPKNILVGQERVILLDCEVAWFGDPAFDLAFLVNHLCLKALYHDPKYVDTRKLVDPFLGEYFSERAMPLGERRKLEARTAKLLAILLLARADGKSPVEYLDDSKFAFIRKFAVPRISEPAANLNSLLDDWFRALESQCRS